MKNFKYILSSFLILAVVFTGCQDDDNTFGNVTAPTNLTITAEILGVDAANPNGDGSGLVELRASATNALSYNFQYGDGQSEAVPSGEVTHRFSIVGTNSYTIIVSAIGTGGVSTTATITIEVFSSFDDQEAKEFLSGGIGSSKVWYLDAAEPGHLGVGPTILSGDPAAPNSYWYPAYFATQPYEKCGDPISSCLCNDELTFSLNADNQLMFELNNQGQTFFNASHQDIVGGSVGEDACFDFDTSGVSLVSLAPSEDLANTPDPDFQARGTVMHFSDDAFMGYYVSSSSYEIISVTNTTLYVRTIDGSNQDLAWYHKYSTSPPDDGGIDTDYTDLVWFDEFDTDGAPDPSKWTYDYEDGCQIDVGLCGWGNNEEQWYTDDADNVIVEDGSLKITAIKEAIGTSEYSSARLKTKDLYEFNNGRVEIRAKLPSSVGTWPAFWMLGANVDDIGWPQAGEIDIMEHSENINPDDIVATCWWDFEGNIASHSELRNVENLSTEFHIYSLEWRPTEIQIAVDGSVYYTLAYDETFPFNLDFFILINLAMGGDFGGAIDPAFTEDTLEVDYVRVYQ